MRCEHYLLLAVDLDIDPSSDELYERWEGLMFPWRGEGAVGKMGILWDGMGGQYVLAGRCIAIGTDEDGFVHGTIGGATPGQIIDVQEWLDANGLSQYTKELPAFHLLSHYH